MFGSLFVACWSVGDQEPAVIKLVSHFRHVIANIVVGNHKELPATGVITSDLVKRKKKRYFFTAATVITCGLRSKTPRPSGLVMRV